MNQAQLKIHLEKLRCESMLKKTDGREAFVDLGCFARQIPDQLWMAEFFRHEQLGNGQCGKIILRNSEGIEHTIIPAHPVYINFHGNSPRNAEVILNGAGHIIVLEWHS